MPNTTNPFTAGTPMTAALISPKFPQSWPASALAVPNVSTTQTTALSAGQIANVVTALTTITANPTTFGMTPLQAAAVSAVLTLFSGLSTGSITFTVAQLKNIVTVSQMIRSWSGANINQQTTAAMTALTGIITGITLTSGGENYVNGVYAGVTLYGGTGSGATANITVTGSNIESFGTITGGSGYTPGTYVNAPILGHSVATLGTITPGTLYTAGTYSNVPLTGGTGSGATANITVAGGAVTVVTLDAGGEGYTAADTLSAAAANIGGTGSGFSVPVATIRGTGATATVTVTALSSISVSIANAGSGYNVGTYSGISFTGGSGTGATGTVIVSGGSIASITITAGGTGYPNGTFSGIALSGGSGQSAIATFTVAAGVVTNVTIAAGNGGQLYNVGDVLGVNLSTNLSNGTGFKATVTSVTGAVTSVAVINGGTNYVVGDIISATAGSLGGAGSGFQAAVDAVGSTVTISLTTGGSGYVSGVYNGVGLTGGSGSGAIANISVVGGAVSSVTLVNGGTGYLLNDVLSTPNSNLGGSGSGFTTTVTSAGNAITAISIVNGGTGFIVGDAVTASGIGSGTGFSVPVASIGGVVSAAIIASGGFGYLVGDQLNALNTDLGSPSGSGFIVTVASLSANPIVTIPYPFPNGATTVTVNDGYALVDQPGTGNFWSSLTQDFTKWSGELIGQIQSRSDNIIAVDSLTGGLIIPFGTRSLETWADGETTPFPFVRQNGQQIDWGLAAKWSRATLADSIIFLGQNYLGQVQVVQFDGGEPIVISTEDINNIINTLPVVNDAFAESFTQDGHEFYKINFPTGKVTLLYDSLTELWSEMTSGLTYPSVHLTQQMISYNYGNYAADATTGNIYFVDDNNYTDNGSYIPWELDSNHIDMDGDEFSISELFLRMSQGEKIPVIGDSTPRIELLVSKDGGYTFGPPRSMSLGNVGQYFFPRVIWRRLGSARQWVFKFKSTSPVPRIISFAAASVRPGTEQ